MIPHLTRCAALLAASTGLASAQETPVAAWERPMQVMPIGPPTVPEAERNILSVVPGTGLVKGTEAALESVGEPLVETPGRNRAVDACRAAVERRAGLSGATQVEAVSSGEDKTDKAGERFAPVRFRVVYKRPMLYEVRSRTMICVVDRAGDFVDAYVPADEGPKPR